MFTKVVDLVDRFVSECSDIGFMVELCYIVLTSK